MPGSGSAQEQEDAEDWFVRGPAALPSSGAFIGVELSGQKWFLADGTAIGDGSPSNSNPYAHW